MATIIDNGTAAAKYSTTALTTVTVFAANIEPGHVVVGDKYTLEIRMDQTDMYDYLIERCTYNGKYHFIDHNSLRKQYIFSCLIPNQYFIQKWENDAYGYPGVSKRTLVHFYAPEPLDAIECRVKVIQCCACAELECCYFTVTFQRACGKDVSHVIEQCPQQVVIVQTNKPNTVALDPTNPQIVETQKTATTLPWWIWIVLAILLLLLLCCCLTCLFYWLYFKRGKASKKNATTSPIPSLHAKSDEKLTDDQQFFDALPQKPIPSDPTSSPAPNAIVAAKQLPKKPHRHRRPDMLAENKARMYYTPSESPTDSVHSSISKSRSAFKMLQKPEQHDDTNGGQTYMTKLPDIHASVKRFDTTKNFGVTPTTETRHETTITQQRLITPLESKASQTLSTSKIHQLDSPEQPQVHTATVEGRKNDDLYQIPAQKGSKLEERYFCRDFVDEKTREEGYDQAQYRYMRDYTESESG
uniref:ZP domain-containing protein n=1 Tax=Syphacia muris TaxID=451379 RepID=A0A0N5AYL3_9BILA